ncbi:MAG: DoxX family protein [Rhodospirillales bacterium]|nr:DoxX family protein [Rhodospirillales bacterium]
MRSNLALPLGSPWLDRLALLLLCAAYIEGGIDKLFDFPGAVAEQAHFGLVPSVPFAIATIVTELGGSALVLAGRLRWLAALWLAGFTFIASLTANAFWFMPPGGAKFMAENAFFEHLGLVGGFLLVLLQDLRAR